MTFTKRIAEFFFCLILPSCFVLAQNSTPYKIKNTITVKTSVSPLLYSNFIEIGFGRSENAMAEMLFNRSFEEDEPVTTNMWVEFTKDKIEQEEWWHSGYETQEWYLKKADSDKESKSIKDRSYWPAGHSKTLIQIYNKSKTDAVYFAQNGIYHKKNMGYHFSGYFDDGHGFSSDKLSTNPVEVLIGLYQENNFLKPLVEKKLLINTAVLSRFELDFPPVDFEGRTSFAIKVPAGRNIAVDLVSLKPNDNIKEWRKDVVEMMKHKVPSPVIRYPGGCYASFYNWRDGIGDEFYRPVDFNNYWESIMLNDMGTIEFVNLCREIKSEPQFCVPVMFKPIEYTIDWLTFCNAPKNALREKYGHPEPLHVKYWELENEMYRLLDAITYAHKSVEYSKAMKAIDPTIKIIMGDYYIYNPKLKEMLEIAGPYIDFINNRGGNMKQIAADIAIINEYNAIHNTSIKICHTELRAPIERGSGEVDGLNKAPNKKKESLQNASTHWAYGMSLVDQMLQYQNFGGDFAFAEFTNYTDTWGENLINVAKEGVYLSSAGRAIEFLNKLHIDYPLSIKNKNADNDIVLQGAWDLEKKHFTLIALNFSKAEKTKQFDISDLKTNFLSQKKFYTVYAENLTDFNSPSNTNKIKWEDKILVESKLIFKSTLKPFSMNAWVFEVGN